MRLTTLLTTLTILCASIATQAQTSRLTIPRSKSAHIGIVVRDLRTGKDVVAENVHKFLTPASTLKCVTAAAVLLDGRENDTFRTSCHIEGDTDGNGTLYGNIILTGSGDPTLESANMPGGMGVIDSIVGAVSRLGIRNIAGCIEVDSATAGFHDQGPIPKWEVEDLKWAYGAGLYALNYRDNTCDGDRALDDPVGAFIDALDERLMQDSIIVAWDDISSDTAQPVVCLYEHRSPPVRTILREMMEKSNNLYAESMLRLLAASEPRTQALEKERKVLSDAGLDTEALNAFDGSGLTRNSKLTPGFLADLLGLMASGPKRELYVSLFPKSGMEGTVKRLLTGTRLAGKLVLKSGSMNGVQCYAGYKIDDAGKPTHVVVIMVNDFICKRAMVTKAISDFLLKQFQ